VWVSDLTKVGVVTRCGMRFIAQGLEDAMALAERILIVGGGIGGLSAAAALPPAASRGTDRAQ
jgi:heterodisulfide reductase subunit A-like polyferredoxin